MPGTGGWIAGRGWLPRREAGGLVAVFWVGGTGVVGYGLAAFLNPLSTQRTRVPSAPLPQLAGLVDYSPNSAISVQRPWFVQQEWSHDPIAYGAYPPRDSYECRYQTTLECRLPARPLRTTFVSTVLLQLPLQQNQSTPRRWRSARINLCEDRKFTIIVPRQYAIRLGVWTFHPR